jgi:hypothetical protein
MIIGVILTQLTAMRTAACRDRNWNRHFWSFAHHAPGQSPPVPRQFCCSHGPAQGQARIRNCHGTGSWCEVCAGGADSFGVSFLGSYWQQPTRCGLLAALGCRSGR